MRSILLSLTICLSLVSTSIASTETQNDLDAYENILSLLPVDCHLETQAFRKLRSRLRDDLSSTGGLSQIAGRLSGSIQSCGPERKADAQSLSELALIIADQLHRGGDLDAAIDMYELIEQALARTMAFSMNRVRAVQGVAIVQLDRDCDECAVGAAARSTDLVKAWHRAEGIPVEYLRDALTFNADVLSETGRQEEANALRTEADRLICAIEPAK